MEYQDLNMGATSQLAKILMGFDRIHRPMISEDAAAAGGVPHLSNHWKRCSELCRKGGYLEVVGKSVSSRGMENHLYVITNRGKAKLKEMGLR